MTIVGAADAAPDEGGLLMDLFVHWLPFVVVVAVAIGGLRLADYVMLRRKKLSLDQRLPRQITMLVLTVLGIVVVVLALPGGENGPVSESTRGDLLSLIGLGVTALITLSSTTLAANAMSGLMLRATAPFRGGDWVRVGDHFGRVTQRGLFHTEIQTEDRDLMSLPNLYLATNPVRIVHEKGTIVSSEVSLGYDIAHDRVEELFKKAALNAGLTDPFVWITELKDHAVVYRVAGLLEDVKGLITVRSRLRACVLDTLHAEGVEIASPGLMIQRRGELTDLAIPRVVRRIMKPADAEEAPVEEKVFDKAEEAARRDQLDDEKERVGERLNEIKEELKKPEADAVVLERERTDLGARLVAIDAEIGELDETEEAGVK